MLASDAARLARFDPRTASVDELARSSGAANLGRTGELYRSQPPVRLYPQELPPRPLNRSQPASPTRPHSYAAPAPTFAFPDDPPPYEVLNLPYEPPLRQYRHSLAGPSLPPRPPALPLLATPPRQSSAPRLSVPVRPAIHGTQSDPLPSTPPRASPSRPSPARASGSPAKTGQCAGTTAKGVRCTRIVGGPSQSRGGTPTRRSGTSSPAPAPATTSVMGDGAMSALNRMLGRRVSRRGPRARPPAREDDDDTSEDEDAADATALDLPVFCHQHAKQAMVDPGAFVGRRGTYIIFKEWIPEELPTECKLQLRHEMAAPTTAHDRPGYIYVHEMCALNRAGLNSRTTYLKLGRSVRPVQRLSEWRSQCPSRQPVVRGIFPLADRNATSSGLAGALAIAPVGAPFHYRLERLLLIEMTARASMEAAQRAGGSAFAQGRTRCADCGRVHCELFEVDRGAYERWVTPMIRRWLMWCAIL